HDAFQEIEPNCYEVDGKHEIFALEEKIGFEFDAHRDEVSIGGYVFSLIGTVPNVGDTVSDLNADFEVLEMDGNRIKRIKIRRKT
ncbi:MAG: hypothetical protein K2N70_04590, partial [Helicobacter sp.]|nr:hypothetical protein [Helicobacter sp.]